VKFFSEIRYGDLHGQNSQQDASTLCNKAPLLKDMKKWTPRRREFKFPVLTAPKHPSLASKTCHWTLPKSNSN
jgi:hypothetical protein